MNRRAFLCGLVASAALMTPARAEGVVDSILRQLRKLGFDGIQQERTLLGRVRITAHRKDGNREIIVNPKTGEILRDLWTSTDGGSGELTIIDDRKERSGSGRDDEDEDDEKDDEKDNNSGHGSGSGGGGGSGHD